VVRARARDTARTIARRYGVTADQVAQWNKVGVKSTFAKGQRVVLHVPAVKRNLAQSRRAGTTKVAKQSSKRSGKPAVKVARKSGKQSKVRVASVR
jgi:membrane-bound lytic murein transglycosylase D